MRKTATNISDFALALLTIMTCNTVFMNVNNGNYNKILIFAYFINLIFGIFLHGLKTKAVTNWLKFLLIYISVLIPFLFINNITSYLDFLVYFVALLPFQILYFYNLRREEVKNLLRRFKRLMLFLAFISLFFYFSINLGILTTDQFVTIRWGSVVRIPSYFHFYFIPQNTILFGIQTFRNSLFFTEPIMYCVFLLFALAIEKIDRNSKRNKLLIFLTILTTTSTAGIILALFYLFYDFVFLNKKKSFYIFLPFVILLVGYFIYVLFTTKMQSMSYSIRIDDYFACLKTWLRYPIFGCGFMNTKTISEFMSSFRFYNLGLSNSIFVILAQGGLYFLIFYLFPLFKLIKNYRKTEYFILIILFILLLFTAVIQYTIFTLTFLSIGFAVNSFKKEGICNENK